MLRFSCVWARVMIVALVPSTIAGCGREVPVYPTSGEVVVGKDRKPAAGAMVFFNAVVPIEGHWLKPAGTVDENGRFNITTRHANDGAPAGDYVITLYWPSSRKSVFDAEETDKLGGRFTDVTKSTLRFTVQPAPKNEMPVIHLP